MPLGFGDSVVLSSSKAQMIPPVSVFLSSSSCFVGFWSLKWTNMAVLALTLQNVPIQSFSSSDLLSI